MGVTVVVALFLAVAFAVVLVRVGFLTGNRSDQDPNGPLKLPNPPASPKQPVITSSGSGDLSALLPPHFVVLDLETTGLNPLMDEIIEIGAVRVTLSSKNHTAFQMLVKPVRKVPRKITEITGITQEMVDREGVPIRAALSQFVDFIGDLPLVTFNAEFDMSFLCAAAKREQIAIGNSYACALKRARRAWPGLQSYRLIDLAKRGNLSTVDAHRALGDSIRALIVFTAATSQLGQKVRWTKLAAD